MADEPEEFHPHVAGEEEEGGPVKSFLEHLEDLRWVLIKSGSALVIGMIVCFAAAPQIKAFMTWPMTEAGVRVDLNPFGPIGGLAVATKIALYGGITLALPFILFFIGQFVMPALKRHEKKYFFLAFTVGSGLFFAGLSLCYFLVLGLAIKGMTQFNAWMGFSNDFWRAEEYFQFVILLMMGMGLSFEIPVLILTLVRVGILSHEMLIKGRKYFFITNLVLCAFITPDFISTFFMVIPVQVLMEICILISAYWERQKKTAAEMSLATRSSDQPSTLD
jgi:sec-independent protein translocase protein TatC